MKITVTKIQSSEVVYVRVLDQDKTLTATVSHLMGLPVGEALETRVENKGHAFVFKTEDADVETIVRKVEGIMIRDKKPVAELPQ